MPTLNAHYNATLLSWARETGNPQQPECEHCGCDLTGQHVIETAFNWLCEPCAIEEGWIEPYVEPCGPEAEVEHMDPYAREHAQYERARAFWEEGI